jgi:16S rRNA (uracil1498-N3)-methyltransferase
MRRIHVPEVFEGEITLDPAEAHHARDVLRLGEGANVEVFDSSGKIGQATIARATPQAFVVRVGEVRVAPPPLFEWTVASAVPKGSRVDWMIEKLSELGTAEFIPLATARSVSLPAGKMKPQRWQRLALEAAKQSRRTGIMRIGELTTLSEFLHRMSQNPSITGWYFSTSPPAKPIERAIESFQSQVRGTSTPSPEPAAPARRLSETDDRCEGPTTSNQQLATSNSLILLIGPEGGFTDPERQSFHDAGLTPVSLGETILRIETAAVAAAAIVAAVLAPALKNRSIRENP